MKLSPLDIYNKEFNKTALGYNVNQVDEFMEELGIAYERLLKEVNNLQDENEKLKEKLSNYENWEDRLDNMLAAVKKAVEEERLQAKKEAELIIRKAELKAEEMEREARKKLEEEYRALQELKENRDLFKLRFQTLLETHLKLLQQDDQVLTEDIAAYKVDLDD